MIPVATSKQMRECDRITIEEIGIPGLVLMENASRAVAIQAMEIFGGSATGKHVVVYCGKGNNGGDGFAVARYLKNAGAVVDVFLLGEIADLKGDALRNCQFFQKISGKVIELSLNSDLPNLSNDVDLIIDALLGTGFQGEVRDLFALVIAGMNNISAPVIAVDMPSGVDADSGLAAAHAVQANATVTFGLMKRGLLLSPGRELAGEVIAADIGIPPEVIEKQDIKVNLVEKRDVCTNIPNRHPAAHKGDAGHVYILAGSPGMTGAAVLSAKSAMRTGAGLVAVGIPKDLNPIIEMKLDEAMSQPLPQTSSGNLAKSALPEILPRLDWADCIVIGPGLGTDSETGELLAELLKVTNKPLIIDADGLNLLAANPALLDELPVGTVLTPHPGEFKRLTGNSLDSTTDKFDLVSSCALKWGATVVLKGSPTITGLPDGRFYINPTGNPGMATGGSGDVLTGIIAGLVAQGLDTEVAAWTGVYIHGAAGDRAATIWGIHSMLAGDIQKCLSKTLKDLSL
ncbi:MAG: NAD(P)H-hydrate dehydratase [Calditrichaeota bacterium]|nr:NAD(P)H-hydrate dehydratase [Calditrichota bacterium]